MGFAVPAAIGAQLANSTRRPTENIYSKELCMLDVRLDIHDDSPALRRLTETLGKKVR